MPEEERSSPSPLLTRQNIERMKETVHVHQFNENAVRHTRSLGDRTGLTNFGIHLVRLEKDTESTQFHFHHCDEEFIYILSGKGIAEIGDDAFEVAAGDFMGFRQHSLPHNMSNPYEEDLVYLMGGNRSEFDICDYPRIHRRMFRLRGERQYADMEHLFNVLRKDP